MSRNSLPFSHYAIVFVLCGLFYAMALQALIIY